MNPFVVDVSAYYGEPSMFEQNSGTILDRRKTLNLHKKLENGIPKEKKGGAIGMKPLSGGAIGINESAFINDLNNAKQGGALGAVASTLIPILVQMAPQIISAFKGQKGGAIGLKEPTGGAININPSGGALAFNEAQLMNELSSIKKGGALPALASVIIPQLIELAPQIVSAIKSMKKGSGTQIGGASAVFLDGVDPSKYDNMIRTLNSIAKQKKNLTKEGGAIRVGSGKLGSFFKNAWNSMKTWYGNNSDKLKPITDILINAGTNAANKYIDKAANYVGEKTGSDTMKQIAGVVSDMAKDSVNNVASTVSNYGSGYDFADYHNDVAPVPVQSKKKRILTALPQNENQIHASVIRKRVY